MTESLPLQPRISQPLFMESIGAINNVMRQRGIRPITQGYAANNLATIDGIEEIESVSEDTVVGDSSEIVGSAEGVAYRLSFHRFNEISGANPYKPGNKAPMVDMRVCATSGDEAHPENETALYKDPTIGILRGIIIVLSDGTIEADFSHGTRQSSDPRMQTFLNKLVSFYGIDSTDLFGEGAPQYVTYNDDRALRLANGLRELASSRDI